MIKKKPVYTFVAGVKVWAFTLIELLFVIGIVTHRPFGRSLSPATLSSSIR